MVGKYSVIVLGINLFLLQMGVEGSSVGRAKEKPNIVMILADDLGSYDISLSGSDQILTPNIDALGYQGVIFNRHYSQALCGPSRAALLTGKYPIHTGQQYWVILPDEPRGLPLDEKILPQYLKEVGYRTHIVGKWHMGFGRKDFIPSHRGFDTHVGFVGGGINYFNHTFNYDIMPYGIGFDFYRNEEVYRDRIGEYTTDVLTDEASKIIFDHDLEAGPLFLYLAHAAPHAGTEDAPLQAIPEDLATVTHIKDPDRRTYAAMVKALDRSVGKVVAALKEKDMLENTIILFFSDNGAPSTGLFANTGSNYPLKGQKDSPWEGGVRGLAAIWSNDFLKRHYVSNHLVSITDWLPTFAQAAGATSYKSRNLDGFDIWPTLSYNKPPLRKEILHNIDPVRGYTSYYSNGWKYINGTTWEGDYDTWLGTLEDTPKDFSYSDAVIQSDVWQALNPLAMRLLKPSDIDDIRAKTKTVCQRKNMDLNTCNLLSAPCLFNVDADPCEMNNLADLEPSRMVEMGKKVEEFRKTMLPPANLPGDPNADPTLNDGLWTWWLDRQNLAMNKN